MTMRGSCWGRAALAGFFFLGLSAMAPPPVPVPVLVVSYDAETQARGEAMVTMLREGGWFADAPTNVRKIEFESCFRAHVLSQSCFRHLIQRLDLAEREPLVVIVATAHNYDGRRVQNWECIGVSDEWRNEARQNVRIDLDTFFFGEEAARRPLRNEAAGCIMAAGAESGW